MYSSGVDISSKLWQIGTLSGEMCEYPTNGFTIIQLNHLKPRRSAILARSLYGNYTHSVLKAKFVEPYLTHLDI